MTKKRLRLSLLVLLVPVLCRASTPDCIDLYLADLGVAIHASNILNSKVTRTPDGGPYRRQDVVRTEHDFEVRTFSDFKLVYEPGHPDGNANGLVSYPNIDEKKEHDRATMAARALKLLARHKICGTSLEEDGNTAYIRYDKSVSFRTPDIFSDILVFSNDGNLNLWTRRLASGEELSAHL